MADDLTFSEGVGDQRKNSANALATLKLEQIIESSYDSILVTDRSGEVLLANPACARLLNIKLEKLVGSNVKDLIKEGFYNRSTALEAALQRTVVTGLVTTENGMNLMSTSMPLLGETGEVIMVVTNTRDNDVVEKYMAALEEARAKAYRYKTAMEYLNELDMDNKTPTTENPAMQKIITSVEVIAKVDSTVLLLGESGSGKEVFARYIHRQSPRAKEPFIPVNCAAVPRELLEAEFFGYTRGAFTGANTQGKQGFFEIADHGTLFLDEIAELPMPMQSKLLRVLETGEIQRVGSTSVISANVRIVAATNKNLKKMVADNLFREDLYYRLNVIPIIIPPLRERPEDIIALAQKFLNGYNKKYAFKKTFSAATIQAFLNYSWPGNVRELRNVVERLAITSQGSELEFESDWIGATKSVEVIEKTQPPVFNDAETLKTALKKLERQYINQVLGECGGSVSEAAKRLGIHRTMLYRKLQPATTKTWVAK